MLTTILFYLFASLAIIGSLMVVYLENPIYCVLSLIFTFFNAAALVIMLGAEFMAMMFVIVYVGAVAVLFLFVIMMIEIKITDYKKLFSLNKINMAVFSLALFISLAPTLIQSAKNYSFISRSNYIPKESSLTNTQQLGSLIYTEYFPHFQLVGTALFVAMISCIVLTLRKREGFKKQNISKQLERTKANSLNLVNTRSGEGLDESNR
jgi:NADH-quinone oxidoreductase subunit J